MRTFNNNPELKNELLKKLKHHQELDAFVQGEWLTEEKIEGNGYRGCFYGCTMQTKEEPILRFSEKYNIDLWYCYLTESIFENLPEGEYQKFPLQSIEILPVGFNINKIKSPFFYTLLEDQLQYCQDDELVTEAVKKCRDLFKVDFESIDKSAAEEAWVTARVTAKVAAWSAESAWSAAWSAARSTREAAELAEVQLSARVAAQSSAWAARSAAKKDYYIWLRDLLFKLIKENSL